MGDTPPGQKVVPGWGRGLGTPSCPLPTSIQPNRAEMTESDSVGGRGRVFSLHMGGERELEDSSPACDGCQLTAHGRLVVGLTGQQGCQLPRVPRCWPFSADTLS